MNNCNEFLSKSNATIIIGHSTLPSQKEADLLVKILQEQGLIACAQIEGPILSKYTWNGKAEESEEWRITLKFKNGNIEKLTKVLQQYHPYENPEWVYWEAKTTKAYSGWVKNPKGS